MGCDLSSAADRRGGAGWSWGLVPGEMSGTPVAWSNHSLYISDVPRPRRKAGTEAKISAEEDAGTEKKTAKLNKTAQ